MQSVAILLATYNGEKYIEEFLISLQGQTFQNYICYIHDDGSKDRTRRIAEEFEKRDPGHFQILEGPSQGGAKENFLWMLGQIEAEFYMFADQDDVWLPEKIEKSVRTITEKKEGPQAGEEAGPLCVFTDMYVTDEKLRVMSDSFIRYIGRDPHRIKFSQVVIDNPAAGCTMIFTRKLRDMAIQLKHPKRVEMHDVWVLALAAACGEQCIRVLDEPLVCYRQHGDNEMGAFSESFLEKIKRNARDVLSGNMAREKREFVQKARILAGELCLVEGLPEKNRKILKAFSEIGEKGKLTRVLFYRKYDFSRNRGTIWMYLWV